MTKARKIYLAIRSLLPEPRIKQVKRDMWREGIEARLGEMERRCEGCKKRRGWFW